ncbi:autotransporter domain-containing protein [Lysobacter antibioticus]|uniref:autotransporter domain-containing protein n=1 Tax=Lysobacter antibioticus TaxID=84531 RepID=UPI0003450240|nr:autotransporter domain-containing protein [Lysobacter antibioticus]
MQGDIRNTRATDGRSSRGAHPRSLLSLAIVGGLLAAAAAPAAAQSAMGQIGNPDSWRSAEFEADWGLAAMNAHHAYARGLTGKGVRLGLFDSGSALAHQEFGGRNTNSINISNVAHCADLSIVAGDGACGATRGDKPGYEYTGVGANVPERIRQIIAQRFGLGFLYDDHGTHVAGTIGANRDGQGTHGVAFASDLTAARVFGDTYSEWRLDPDGFYRPRPLYRTDPEDPATLDMYHQAQALGTRVLNHSWGPTRRNATEADLEAHYASTGAGYAVYASIYAPGADGKPQSDLIQVWAAGNQSGGLASIPATLPRWRPEAEPYWVSVANVRQPDPAEGEADYVINDGSSICGLSMNWCVSAPGTDIDSTVVGGRIDGAVELTNDYLRFRIDNEQPEYGYGLKTGTSMAAPHVTGALGLLFERFPYLSSPQVRDVLLTTATDLGAPGIDDVYGWGLVNLKKAIDGPGQLRVDTDVVMDRPGGGAKVWEGKAWDDWRNDIGGSGKLTKSGIGWLRLSGNNSFGGLNVKQGVLELTGANTYAAQVESGTLVVNGSLTTAELPVLAKGGLGGSGRIVGNVRVDGALSPGNSIGTLTVQGNYVQGAGGSYVAELSAGGQSDRLDVTGRASLDGKLIVLHAPGQYLLGQNFNILNAAGGVSGQFASVDQTAFSPFLKFGLSYAANAVSVDVTRGASLATAAQTENQRAAAAAADRLAVGQGIPQPLTQLFPAQALVALDSLSGESHASLRSILVDDGRHVRDAALNRARAGRGAFAADNAEGGAQGAWIELLKSGGTLDGDGNAARNEYNGSATLVGYDYRFDGGWRIGVLAGSGRTDSDSGRNDKGRVDTRHLGLYAGQNWGAFGLSAGLGFARHDIDLDRRIGFNGFVDRTRASYDADSRQAFVEGGYRLSRGAWEFEPYAQFAQVRVDSDRFQEEGGAAALSGRSAESRVNLSTLGVRFNVNLKGSQQEDSWLSLRGGIGRRHASGDLRPEVDVAWRGGEAFRIHGAPLADNATLVETGVAARLSANSLLELHYAGQFADEARDHGINARYSLRF